MANRERSIGMSRWPETILALAAMVMVIGCAPEAATPPSLSGGIVLETNGMPLLQAQISNAIVEATPPSLSTGGLVGAMGGARVKLLSGESALVVVLPQLTDAQIPISYALTVTPPAALAELRLARRDGTEARPLAGFDARGELSALARRAWVKFLETGDLSAEQIRSASILNGAELHAAWSQTP